MRSRIAAAGWKVARGAYVWPSESFLRSPMTALDELDELN